MAMIAAAGGGLAVMLNYLMIITPIPTGALWPGLLLPIVMLTFIAEGSKYLLFDVALCSNPLWFPEGVNQTPQQAHGCSLGWSGQMGIAAGSLFLMALLIVCLLNPRKRELDLDYCLDYLPGPDHDLYMEQTDEEDLRRSGETDEEVVQGNRNFAFDGYSDYDESVYTNGRDPSIVKRSDGSNESDHAGESIFDENTKSSLMVAPTVLPMELPTSSGHDHVSESAASNGEEDEHIRSLMNDLDMALTGLSAQPRLDQ